jgi:hypothetical protein
MSELLVRQALDKHLAGMTGALANTIYENETREAPADAAMPYQKCFLLPAQPDNSVVGAGEYCAMGVFQVSLMYPLGNGPGDAATQAELLRSRFKRGTTITEGGLNVQVTHTPQIARGFEDAGRWHVPVSVRWQAWVHVT